MVLSYWLSFRFTQPALVFAVGNTIYPFAVVLPTLIVSSTLAVWKNPWISLGIHFFFVAIDPPYGLFGSLLAITIAPYVFPSPSVSYYLLINAFPLVVSAIQIAVMIGGIYYIDFYRKKREWKSSANFLGKSEVNNLHDSDVKQEMELVDSIVASGRTGADNVIVLDHLRKEFKKEIAVEDITLKTQMGEIFGNSFCKIFSDHPPGLLG